MRLAPAFALAVLIACDAFTGDAPALDAGTDAGAVSARAVNDAAPVPEAGAPDALPDPPEAPHHSCKEILAQHPDAKSGVFDVIADDTVVPVYCDMTTDGGGWTLVYRVSNGMSGDPLKYYRTIPLNDLDPTEVTTAKTNNAYTSRLLSRWNTRDFTITRARARIVGNDGATMKELVFDATNTQPESFWSQSRIVATPWTDLTTTVSTSDFSVAGGGDATLRRFFAVKHYDDCSTDSGWVAVHGGNPPNVDCPTYESANKEQVRIFVSLDPTAHVWTSGVTLGAAFSILVR